MLNPLSVCGQFDAGFAALVRVDQKAERLAERLAAAAGTKATGRRSGGLELATVDYDVALEKFVVSFQDGREFSLPASALQHHGKVDSVRLDEFKHGVEVTFSDGNVVTFASDLVLFECDPQYRAAHQSRRDNRVGARIRALRLSAGRSAKAIAAAAGIAPSNYARLEAGTHQPRLETIMRVARALDVTVSDLVAESRASTYDRL